MHAVEIKSLSKRFDDVTAVNNCSLTVERGEMFALVGPDGSGKTTTIRMLCGIVPPTGGGLSVLGYDVLTQKEEVKKRGLKGKVRALKSGCMDLCEKGPNVMIFPDGILVSGVQECDIPALLEQSLA